MKKVGILYICTGKYKVFWPEFYLSAEKHLFPGCEKHYFIFTDSFDLPYTKGNDRIHFTEQETYKWPFATLLRFEIFLKREQDLKQMDYLCFFNSNAQFVKTITEDMFLPRAEKNEDLVVVQHAGQYNLRPFEFTYDRNPLSLAFIPYGCGKVYVCGGINGGTSEAYLRMCHVLSERIRKDLSRNIIALWHDESHLNRYILKYKHYRMLTPSYVHPTQERWIIPYESIIELRDKTKYFDVEEFKKDTPQIKPNIAEWTYQKTAELMIRFLRKYGLL